MRRNITYKNIILNLDSKDQLLSIEQQLGHQKDSSLFFVSKPQENGHSGSVQIKLWSFQLEKILTSTDSQFAIDLKLKDLTLKSIYQEILFKRRLEMLKSTLGTILQLLDMLKETLDQLTLEKEDKKKKKPWVNSQSSNLLTDSTLKTDQPQLSQKRTSGNLLTKEIKF